MPKKSILMMIATLIVLFISAILVLANGVDDRGNPNDPAINERANACYEGGTLENKCDTELEWQAGWYLIRYEFGIYDRHDIPGWVAWILPPEIMPEYVSPVSSQGAICPNLSFTCAGLFTCDEARACYQAGNTTLDQDGDTIPCNEAGNLLLNTITCN